MENSPDSDHCLVAETLDILILKMLALGPRSCHGGAFDAACTVFTQRRCGKFFNPQVVAGQTRGHNAVHGEHTTTSTGGKRFRRNEHE